MWKENRKCWEPCEALTFMFIRFSVFANGNEFDAHRIPLDRYDMSDYDVILKRVAAKVTGIIGAPRA